MWFFSKCLFETNIYLFKCLSVRSHTGWSYQTQINLQFILDRILNIINNCNIIKMIRSRGEKFDNHRIIYIYLFFYNKTLYILIQGNLNHFIYLVYQIYFFLEKIKRLPVSPRSTNLSKMTILSFIYIWGIKE